MLRAEVVARRIPALVIPVLSQRRPLHQSDLLPKPKAQICLPTVLSKEALFLVYTLTNFSGASNLTVLTPSVCAASSCLG